MSSSKSRPEPIFWATLDAELPTTPDFPNFRGDLFIDGLEGGSMIWVTDRGDGLYGFEPLNPEFYAQNVQHLILVGAKFDYCFGNHLLARGTVTKVT
jgi:hypothetical protein